MVRVADSRQNLFLIHDRTEVFSYNDFNFRHDFYSVVLLLAGLYFPHFTDPSNAHKSDELEAISTH